MSGYVLEESGAMLSNRTFCEDENVLSLLPDTVAIHCVWILSTWNVPTQVHNECDWETEFLTLFYFNYFNLNNTCWTMQI